MNIEKSILALMLGWLARKTVRTYKPIIIGVTGSVGKTSTREAIAAVLKIKYRIRSPEKNYNNEIGLPLTILGISHQGRNAARWSLTLAKALIRLIIRSPYPEVLVLEYGIDRPGDMNALLAVCRPQIAVVTQIGTTPVHVEFFKGPEDVAAEKAKLVAALPADGCAILNADDEFTLRMRERTKAPIMTFGFGEHALVRVVHYELRPSKEENDAMPDGITIKIEHDGSVVPVRLHQAFGKAQAYTAVAAATVGIRMRMNLVDIARALESYVPPAGRMRLLKGRNNSLILDDSYNAAPASVAAAIETIKSFPAKRSIAVLGAMAELGHFSEEAHREIGVLAASAVNVLITSGAQARLIAEEASKISRSKKKKTPEIHSFQNASEAGRFLESFLRSGDLVLIKGSQSARMERAIEMILEDPADAKHVLVRQESYWKNSS